MNLFDWLTRPWRGLHDAKAALEQTQADSERLSQLTQDLREIQRENHITARMHAAFRGDGP